MTRTKNILHPISLAVGAALLIGAHLPMQAQSLRATLGPSAAPERSTERSSALGAGVPSLGFVRTDGEVYRIDGLPGGATLHPVASTPARGGATRELLAAAGGVWIRSVRGTESVEIPAANGVQALAGGRLQTAFPVGEIALSRSGDTLAVADESGSQIRLFAVGAGEALATAELSAGGELTTLLVSDNGASVLAVRSRDGWTEAVVWDSLSRQSQVLAQGARLSAAFSNDGARLAILDGATGEFSIFTRGAGGFALTASHTIGAAGAASEPSIAAVEMVNGAFAATRIQGREVSVCGESGGCDTSQLPMPEERAIRPLAAGNLLFVESARAGVPNYLLEFTERGMQWHFASREAAPGRSAAKGRGPAAEGFSR